MPVIAAAPQPTFLDTLLMVYIPWAVFWLPFLLAGAYAYSNRPRWFWRDQPKSALLLGAGTAAVFYWLTIRTVMLAVESMHWPLILDAPLMHYIAWRIEQGDVPYRDLFDMNLPGVYVLHLLILKVFGAGDVGWRLFDLSWLAGTDALLWIYCRRQGRLAAGVAVLFYTAFHLSNGPTNAGQRDYLLFTFLLAGTLGVARFLEGEGRLRTLLLAGLALGYGATIKPQAALLWLGLAVYVALAERSAGRPWGRPFGMLLAGGLVAPGLIGLWLGIKGGLGPFLDILFHYVAPLYSKAGRRSLGNCLLMQAQLLLPCAAILALSYYHDRTEVRQRLLRIGVLYGLVHFVLQGKGWVYHLYPLMGFGCALAASGFTGVRLRIRRPIQALYPATGLAFAIAIGLWSARLAEAMRVSNGATALVASIQKDLTGRVPPDGTIQIFDTAAGGIHTLLRLHVRQPTRFLYDFFFFRDGQTAYIRGLKAEMLHSLQTGAPDYLIVYEWGWPSGDYDRFAAFPELQRFIQDNYVLDVERAGYRIYARRENPSQQSGSAAAALRGAGRPLYARRENHPQDHPGLR